MRQAIFDMLMHAPWGGAEMLRGAVVLDAFAGTGAMGLEALSRGARHAVFMERDASALASLRANIASCRAGDRATVLPADALAPPRGQGCNLVFLDPPYNQGLAPQALGRLRDLGWVVPGSLIIAETGRGDEPPVEGAPLARRLHGAACVNVWREN